MSGMEDQRHSHHPVSGSASPQSSDGSSVSAPGQDFNNHHVSGASTGCSELCRDGSGEPVSSVMDGKDPAVAGDRALPGSAVQGSLPKTSRGGGIADMLKMVSGGGDMCDMPMSIMSEMSAMMSNGGLQKSPMGMAKLFECIIDISLAKVDSEASEEKDDCVAAEIPCEYCSRLFSSQMSLRTHILVAHDQEDTSLLNLRDLLDSKGRRGSRDTPHSCQSPCSDKCAAEAAGGDMSVAGGSAKVSCQEDPSAAVSGRGVKRVRNGNWHCDTDESGGAADEESHVCDSSPQLGAGALPSCVDGQTSPETRKRKTRLRSCRSSSEESFAQAVPKRSKGAVAYSHSSCAMASPQDAHTDVKCLAETDQIAA